MKIFFTNETKISRFRIQWICFLKERKFFLLLFLFTSFSFELFSQIIVTGIVRDATGLPLHGVTVNLKSTAISTTTDNVGKYSITCPDLQGVLVFSFVGYSTDEVSLNNRNVVNVELKQGDQALSEVVVTGYTTQQKKDITGSVAVVNMKDMKAIPTGSAAEALQGMASGVNIIRSGAPFAASKILIRGITNFGNTNPLVIVDGIEQNLELISPEDVESVQILKDGSAGAIYGSRGANGVILVTTKRGETGAPVISYEGSYGIQFPHTGNPYNLLNPTEYMQIYNEVFPGNPLFKDGFPEYTYRGPAGAGVAFEGDPNINPDLYFLEAPNKGKNYVIYKMNKQGTDWFHELYKKASLTRNNLNVSGGGEKAKYFFSLGHLDNEGTLIKSFLKRENVRINTDFKIGKNFKIGENLNVVHSRIGNIFGSTAPNSLMAMIPLKDIKGNWAGSFAGSSLGQGSNPVAAQYRHIDDVNYSLNVIGSGYAELNFLRKFTIRTSLGYNYGQSYVSTFNPTPYETSETNNAENQLSISSSYAVTTTFTNTLNYRNTFSRHDFSILIGSEAIEADARGQSGLSKSLFSSEPNFLFLENGQEGTNSSSIATTTLFSLFGRIDYSYNNKYLFSATARRDGSSRFGEGKKYGVFPSFSLGWRVSEEEFLENINWIDDLKLRVGYGVLGSQSNVSANNQYTLFYSGRGYPDAVDHYYDLAGTGSSALQGFGVQRYGNPFTSWEENIITNIGLDAAILNRRLEFSIEYYKKSINGLLFTEPLPAVVGDATAPQINIGDIQNTGIDFSAMYHGKIGRQFTYFIRPNITHYKNKIVHIPDPGYFDVGVVRNEEGFPVSSFFGYKVLGIFQNDNEVALAPTQTDALPGRFRYADIDGNGKITPDDRTHLADPNPEFTYGLNLGFTYKNFDFSAFVYGSQGNEIYNSLRRALEDMALYPQQGKSKDLLKAWTPKHPETNIPRIGTVASFSTYGVNNSYFIEDGSYLKLRSLILGYTLNREFLKNKINKLRVYLQAANLFTFTKYSGIDPEIGGSSAAFGIGSGSYPTDETNIILGLSITL